MKNISIVVPVFNEEKNILSIIREIHKACTNANLIYEIIFIDDHSTDKTVNKIISCIKKYPVTIFEKQGKKGKAQSLLEGFAKAKYHTLCMIDGDMQYPPQAIPLLVKKLAQFDIVVAQRYPYHVGLLRKCMSKIFNYVFGKVLHGLECDVQSGLKVFKKEIIERLDLTPGAWNFDLEFLVKAQIAGYKIGNVAVDFYGREFGNSKISIVQTASELAISALILKWKKPTIINFHPKKTKIFGRGFHFKGDKFVTHTDLQPKESALYNLSIGQKLVLVLLGLGIALGFFIQGVIIVTYIFSLLTCFYFADLLFNFFLIYKSFLKEQEFKIHPSELNKITQWPKYTIFCPLYKEWNILPQFTTAIQKLDYPKEQLEVMLLLEEDDIETQQHIQRMDLPPYFQVRVIPHSAPKTKPKALNFGLQFATGEYVVIYDAEDVPDPDQLKKAVVAFHKLGKQTMCVQAKLNFYNPQQNLLTRLFTAEYSLWFDLVLTGLHSIYAPIPLGGTSNHFRREDIIQLSGWDPFNVTEDADLGMRLAKRGYHTAIMNSTTQEEANSNVKNWLRQRSRWIKGYIQTYFVHMRSPQQFLKHWKNPQLLTFQLIIGGKVLSLLINPLMWVMTISYFALHSLVGATIESFFPGPIFYIAVVSLFIGNFLYIYYYMLGCSKRQQWELIPFMIFIPLYWLLMSIAAIWALGEFIIKPHYWQKTQHGLHLVEEKSSPKRWVGFVKEKFAFVSG